MELGHIMAYERNVDMVPIIEGEPEPEPPLREWEWIGESDYAIVTGYFFLYTRLMASCPWPVEVLGYHTPDDYWLIRRMSHEASVRVVDGVENVARHSGDGE